MGLTFQITLTQNQLLVLKQVFLDTMHYEKMGGDYRLTESGKRAFYTPAWINNGHFGSSCRVLEREGYITQKVYEGPYISSSSRKPENNFKGEYSQEHCFVLTDKGKHLYCIVDIEMRESASELSKLTTAFADSLPSLPTGETQDETEGEDPQLT